jgi:putative heme-binding domain-containing protein
MRLLLLILGAASALAADNPLGRDPAAVAAGQARFLERCAVCHGQDATGSQAANLVRARIVVAGRDGALFSVIRKGLPGTAMPPQADLDDEQVWQLVSFLHSLARPGEQPPVEGDAAAGARLFRDRGCLACHIVDGSGGFLGPGLDSIATRKKTEEIRADIVDPNASVAQGYGRVVVRTKDGSRIEGLLKNEDMASLQVLTSDGAYALLRRSEVDSVETPAGSTMPAPSGLTDEQVQNLLAFLDLQRDPFLPFERGFQNY